MPGVPRAIPRQLILREVAFTAAPFTIRCSASLVPLSWLAFTSFVHLEHAPPDFPDGNKGRHSPCGQLRNDRSLQVDKSAFWNAEIIRYGEHHHHHHRHHHHHHHHHSDSGRPATRLCALPCAKISRRELLNFEFRTKTVSRRHTNI